MGSLHPRSLLVLLCLIYVMESFSANHFKQLSYKVGVYSKLTSSEKSFGEKSKIKPKHYELQTRKTWHSRRFKRDAFSEDPCYEYGLCRSNDDKDISFCHCDRYCAFYGDCCYDVDFNEIDMSPSLPKPELRKCYCWEPKNPLKCYNLVTRCPDGYKNKEISTVCSGVSKSFIKDIPVWDDKGVTYYNAFCALCNNVTNYKPAYVTFDVKKCFKPSVNYTNQIAETKCEPTFIPPKGLFYRKCVDIPSRNKNDKCTYHQIPIKIYESWYKNYFCSHFSNRYSGLQSKNYECFTRQVNDPMFDVLPLTVMFTFSPLRIAKEKGDCDASEKYDYNWKMCRKISCESGREPYDGMCIGTESFTNYKFKVDYRFFVNETVDKRYLVRISRILYQILQYEKYQITVENIHYAMTHGLRHGSQSTCSNIAAQVTFNIGYKYLTKDEIDAIKLTMFDFKWSFLETTESNGQITKLNTVLRIDQCHLNTNETSTSKWNNKDMSSHQKKVIKSAMLNSDFCLDVHIKCTYSDNGTIQITSQTCGQSKAITFDNAVQSFPRFMHVQTILTYVCMGLSCTALSISVFIYRVLDFSTSVPGSNTENLYITLLFTHVLFMAGIGANDNQIVCKCLGIVIHYFWLASFTFMTIAALNIAVTFSKMLKNPNKNKTPNECLKRKLISVGYILPIMVVLPCVLLDFLNLPSFRIEYDGNVCFPTGYPANIIFVSGPMALSVTINVICLLIVMCSIRRQTANTKQIDKGFISYLPVYLRLSLLVGILWIFGIISAVMTNEILENLFIVLGSLQGFFVSVAGTCTVRVYNSLKSRLKP